MFDVSHVLAIDLRGQAALFLRQLLASDVVRLVLPVRRSTLPAA
jgi:glycine cleavage system aminomethyltransferase T